VAGDFYGLPTGSLDNGWLRVDYLSDVGPRIVRLCLSGSDENLLAEVPDLMWETPFGDYFLRGGHRLWHAPEAYPRTYGPDNAGLRVEETGQGVHLCQPKEAGSGISKSIEIRLHADRPAVTLHHTLQNEGLWPVELAPWAITQLPLGGVAVLPQRAPPLASDPFYPNRHIALWPMARWSDPRLHIHDDFVLVHAQPRVPPLKLGYLNRLGWAGYLHQGVFFCKRFEHHAGAAYPDLGSNVEVYCENRFLELETLGPLVKLEPGQSVSHTEVWEIYADLEVSETVEGIQDLQSKLGL
jgi:hypothetical protein